VKGTARAQGVAYSFSLIMSHGYTGHTVVVDLSASRHRQLISREPGVLREKVKSLYFSISSDEMTGQH
jgi:hypothetical protein